MSGQYGLTEEQRFMNKVLKAASGCWLWQGYCMPQGYGNFRTPKRQELAHRASYRLFKGPLQDCDVLHSCDNPSCVNPDHLSLGTHLENMRGCKRRGRNAFGEKHGRRKLSLEQVRAIKLAEGRQSEIAKVFGISQTTVSEIKLGKKWATSL